MICPSAVYTNLNFSCSVNFSTNGENLEIDVDYGDSNIITLVGKNQVLSLNKVYTLSNTYNYIAKATNNSLIIGNSSIKSKHFIYISNEIHYFFLVEKRLQFPNWDCSPNLFSIFIKCKKHQKS